MIRQSIATYNILFYLNADERRENDPYWNEAYGVVTSPLVRSLIDCLYNVTAILENPTDNGSWYHVSGLKKRLLDIEEDERTYAGKPEWDEYNARQKRLLFWLIRADGFTEQAVRNARTWKTLGSYLLEGRPEDSTPHQRFLNTFTHMQWRQYSALSHASFDGYIGELPAGAYLILDTLSHEQRPVVEEMYKAFLTRHIGRAAMILLCLVTELQLYFRFEGANINARIEQMWGALMGVFEVKEIFDERYRDLMLENGILPNE